MHKLYIILSLLLLPAICVAQERTASGSQDIQASWTALKTLVEQAKGNADVALTLAEAIKTCGIKGAFYSPDVKGADKNGCLKPTEESTDCGAGGALVGGACWYMSAPGQNCKSVCAPHGGYSAATRTYAGSGGSNAKCSAVLNALGEGPVSSISNYCSQTCSSGCARHTNGVQFRATSQATTEAALYGNYRRACACKK